MASTHDLSAWDKDGRVFLFTSLTAGSSHIITATSRIETILNANRIPFVAIDTATNDLARRLWGRRSAGKKLPALVKEGYVIADLAEVEEWNEFGEIQENIGEVPPASSDPPPGGDAVTTRATIHATQPVAQLPVKPTATATQQATASDSEHLQSHMANLSMKEAATQAASIGAARKGPIPGINHAKVVPLESSLAEAEAATNPETISFSSNTKAESIRAAEANATQASTATDPSSLPSLTAVKSGDDLAANATPAGAMQQKHRGSSVSSAAPEDIQELEKSSAIPEVDDEDETSPKTQDQGAGVPDKAAVSVQD